MEETKKKKPIFKKWWFWVVIGVVAIIVIVAATSGGSGGSKEYNQASSKALESFVETDYNTFNYDTLARDTDSQVGALVKYRGKVVQVVTANSTYRISVGGDSDKMVWSEKAKGVNVGSLLEDDMVDVWGVVKGQKSYTALLGNKIYIPDITIVKIEKVDINSLFEYTDAPFTVTEEAYGGTRTTTIESCKITSVTFSYDGGYVIDFEIVGTLEGYEYLYLYFNCYDANGLFLEKETIFTSVSDGVKFKITEEVYISKDTAKIVFEKD